MMISINGINAHLNLRKAHTLGNVSPRSWILNHAFQEAPTSEGREI